MSEEKSHHTSAVTEMCAVSLGSILGGIFAGHPESIKRTKDANSALTYLELKRKSGKSTHIDSLKEAVIRGVDQFGGEYHSNPKDYPKFIKEVLEEAGLEAESALIKSNKKFGFHIVTGIAIGAALGYLMGYVGKENRSSKDVGISK